MAEVDYVLGTHDAEIDRLGLQHRVWRPYALDAWRRANITAGQTVIDFGAGPGFAATDLAEIVGAAGRIVALERSDRFIAALNARAAALGLSNIDVHAADLARDSVPSLAADAAWARWIFAFLPDPLAALRRLAGALKPGAALVIHEYLDYATWRLSPRSAAFETFVDVVIDSWRTAGGEPNVGLDLPRWLEESGFAISAQRQIVEFIEPRNFMWGWPLSFIDTNLDRQVELGRFTVERAQALRAEMSDALAARGVRMVTPVVIEIIARKTG